MQNNLLPMTAPTLHGTTINRFLVLNPPDSPPPVYDPCDVIINESDGEHVRLEHIHESCLNCHSSDLFLDCSQGDRVCHQCGHVAEGHVMMNQPQLHNNNNHQPPSAMKDALSSVTEEDDDGKRIPFACNSELFSDELIHSSIMTFTTLSKHAFGKRSRSRRVARIRKTLQSTNQIIMEQMVTQNSISNHAWGSEDHYCNEQDDRCASPPVVLQEEIEDEIDDENNQNQKQQQTALYVDKWSLERAILLYGSQQEQTHEGIDEITSLSTREELLSNMDETLRRASLNLYIAYSMTVNAIETLHLPSRVTSEVTERLVRYAYQNDGFVVKGVHSKLSKKHHGKERDVLEERLKEYNTLKQISAVGAATLFLSARNLGWIRSMEAVCSCFRPQIEMNANEKIFLKPKHMARAVAQVKDTFPDYARLSIGQDTSETDPRENMRETVNNPASRHFPDEIIEKLQLPPVAEASIQLLFSHFKKHHRNGNEEPSGNVAPWTLCAAVTHFVCSMGSSMQTLAKEIHRTTSISCSHQNGKRSSDKENAAAFRQRKRRREENPSKNDGRTFNINSQASARTGIENVADVHHEEGDLDPTTVAERIGQNQSLKRGYEMRRMWDAWESQRSWSRSVAEIEQCCGISREALLDAYQTEVCPHRHALLCMLKDSSQVGSRKDVIGPIQNLCSAPLASILLADISTVAPLLMEGQDSTFSPASVKRTDGLV